VLPSRKKDALAAWRPHDSWGGLIISTAARIKELGQEDLVRAGLGHLSYGRIGVLSLLWPGPLTQADLCRALGQTPPSMMEMLARLKAEGLVTATPDPTDRRKTGWSLTARGKRDVEKARGAFRRSGAHIDRLFRRYAVDGAAVERSKEILRIFLQHTPPWSQS
jgi:DNA-binding MarR family transcriptional regulator